MLGFGLLGQHHYTPTANCGMLVCVCSEGTAPLESDRSAAADEGCGGQGAEPCPSFCSTDNPLESDKLIGSGCGDSDFSAHFRSQAARNSAGV